MYAISVVIGPAMFPLMFKQEEKAREAEAVLAYNPAIAISSSDWISIKDDFGHEFACARTQLAGYIFEDMEKTKLAHCERALHQQKTQNLAQKMASADPGLRMAQGLNGPGMIQPFPGMRQ